MPTIDLVIVGNRPVQGQLERVTAQMDLRAADVERAEVLT